MNMHVQHSAEEVGRRAARLEKEFKSLKRATRFSEGPCSTAERPPEKKQLWECTIKAPNSELQWMELYNKMAFEQIQGMFLRMWYQAFRWIIQSGFSIRIIIGPKMASENETTKGRETENQDNEKVTAIQWILEWMFKADNAKLTWTS